MPTTATAQALGQVAHSRHALLVVDHDCVCVEASLGACTMLGLGRSEVVGRAIAALFEAESRERFMTFWQRFHIDGGRAEPFALDAPATLVDVGVRLSSEILPSRHMVTLERISASAPAHINSRSAGAVVHERDNSAAVPAVRTPTARELEVLCLVAGGATDAQIADLLELSPATVQTHVRNAKAKLGARTRAHAVAMAVQRGIVATV